MTETLRSATVPENALLEMITRPEELADAIAVLNLMLLEAKGSLRGILDPVVAALEVEADYVEASALKLKSMNLLGAQKAAVEDVIFQMSPARLLKDLLFEIVRMVEKVEETGDEEDRKFTRDEAIEILRIVRENHDRATWEIRTRAMGLED